jgi:hypothetical protein
MTELEKIFLTSGLTVVGGSLVFVIQRFVLDPLNEQSKVFGRITFALYYHGREYGNPIPRANADAEANNRYREAANKMRELAGLLAETSQSVRLYWICVLLRGTRRRKHIDDAIGLLTRLSNSFFIDDNTMPMPGIQNGDDADAVLKLLHLRKWGR